MGSSVEGGTGCFPSTAPIGARAPAAIKEWPGMKIGLMDSDQPIYDQASRVRATMAKVRPDIAVTFAHGGAATLYAVAAGPRQYQPRSRTSA